MNILAKLALIFLAMIALALGGLYLVLTNGSLQKQFAMRVLPPDARLEAIQLKFSSGRIEGFAIPLDGGGSLKIDRGEFRYQPFAWLLGQTVHIDTIRAEGLEIVLPPVKEAAPSDDPEKPSLPETGQTDPPREDPGEAETPQTDPAPGSSPVRFTPKRLNDIKLKMVIREVSIDGVITDTDGQYRFEFSSTGGNIRPGETGELEMVARLDTGSADSSESAARVRITTRLAQARDGGIQELSNHVEGNFIPSSLARLPAFQDLAQNLPAELGPGSLDMNFTATPERLALDAARFTWKTADGRDALRVGLSQPVELAEPANVVTLARPEEPMAEVFIDNFSTTWLNPWIPEGIILNDAGMRGRTRLYYSEGRLRIDGVEAFQLKAFSMEEEGIILVPPTDFTLALQGVLQQDDFSFTETRVSVVTSGKNLLVGSVSGKVPTRAKGSPLDAYEILGDLQVDLALLSSQPYSTGFILPLQTGRMEVRFDRLSTDPGTHFSIGIADLQLSTENRAGPMDLVLEGKISPGGGDNQQRINLAGSLGPRNSGPSGQSRFEAGFDVTTGSEPVVASGFIHAPLIDLQHVDRLTAIFPPKDTQPPADPETEPAKPFWKGFAGDVSIRVDRLELPDASIPIEDIQAEIALDERTLQADAIQLRAGPGAATGNATLEILDPAEDYAVTADLVFSDLDPGIFLQGGKRFSGMFDGQAFVSGQGTSIPEALQSAETDLALEATNGRLTLFDLEMPAANAAMIGLNLIGRGNPGGRFEALSEAIPYFNEISFDSLELDLKRSAAGKIDLSTLALAGPFLNIRGSGSVSPGNWQDMLTRPMSMQLQMGAKGELATHLQPLGLIEPNPAPSGYFPLTRSIDLGGTLENPDAASLQRLLVDAALKSLTGSR